MPERLTESMPSGLRHRTFFPKCLESSNVVLHGYGGKFNTNSIVLLLFVSSRSISVETLCGKGGFRSTGCKGDRGRILGLAMVGDNPAVLATLVSRMFEDSVDSVMQSLRRRVAGCSSTSFKLLQQVVLDERTPIFWEQTIQELCQIV